MACLACGQQFHDECSSQPCCCGSSEVEVEEVSSRRSNRGKRDEHLKDQQSTGRKRAAIKFPLDRDEKCEWQGFKNVGGNKGIVGCLAGKQQARHHGPDKNTLNNNEGNVHRICHNCHNRWHTINDEGYDWGELHPAHSPVGATLEELLESEVQWQLKGKLTKVVD